MSHSDARRQSPPLVTNAPLLELEDVSVTWPSNRGREAVPAVRGVSLQVAAGESVALVGASGSGKTSLARAIVGLVPFKGVIRFDGRPLNDWLGGDAASFRRRVQLLLQNSSSALNPRMTIGEAIDEVLRVHRPDLDPAGRRREIGELLEQVELPGDFAGRLPHRASGGERQRASLARALAVRPEVLILDEPVSSLDAQIRGRVLEVLKKVQQLRRLAYLYIAHDLAMVSAVCERVAVMHAGEVVEAGETSVVFTRPEHIRTRELLTASPVWSGLKDGSGSGV